MSDLMFEYLYSQCLILYSEIEGYGIDVSTLFWNSGYGVFDAECMMELLFC